MSAVGLFLIKVFFLLKFCVSNNVWRKRNDQGGQPVSVQNAIEWVWVLGAGRAHSG